jgi:hypothetical protein
MLRKAIQAGLTCPSVKLYWEWINSGDIYTIYPTNQAKLVGLLFARELLGKHDTRTIRWNVVLYAG